MFIPEELPPVEFPVKKQKRTGKSDHFLQFTVWVLIGMSLVVICATIVLYQPQKAQLCSQSRAAMNSVLGLSRCLTAD